MDSQPQLLHNNPATGYASDLHIKQQKQKQKYIEFFYSASVVNLAKPIPAKAIPIKRPRSVGTDQRPTSGKIGFITLHYFSPKKIRYNCAVLLCLNEWRFIPRQCPE